MGTKSDLKRAYIVKTAGSVYADKGYKDVTMKDIAAACHISRGGLYLYYSDTDALFLDVLAAESERAEASLAEAMRGRDSALERLSLFLKSQKKEIFASRDNYTVASYEYAFAHVKSDAVRRTIDRRVETLRQLIEDGVAEGSFICDDPRASAVSIVLHIEGLRAAAMTALLTTAEADTELQHIRESLLKDSEVQ